MYNRLPEDEPSSLNHVEDITNEKLIYEFIKGEFYCFILYNTVVIFIICREIIIKNLTVIKM